MDLSLGINSIIAQKLSSVLKKCSLWLVDNRLSLHLGKTESILFGPPKLKNFTDFKILCDGHHWMKYLVSALRKPFGNFAET